MERRRSPRMNVRLPLNVVSEGVSLTGTTVNLSVTGACVLVNGHLEEFSSVALSLELHVPVEEKLEVFDVTLPGVVVRAETAEDRAVIAVMFQHLPLESEWALSKFILENIGDM